MIPFCEVENHATTCTDNRLCALADDNSCSFLKYPVKKQVASYRSLMLKVDGEVFFLRAKKDVESFTAELVMKADEEKCNKFSATISILDSKLRPAYNATFSPRPLGISNEEDACLSVRMKSLAKVLEPKDDKYEIKVRVEIRKSAEDESEMEDSEEDTDENMD